MCMISIPLRRWDFDMKYLAYRPVTDYNEITNHVIESIYVHFYNTRLRVLIKSFQIFSDILIRTKVILLALPVCFWVIVCAVLIETTK